MTCGDKFNRNCPTGGTKVAPAEVDGRPRCRNVNCQAVLRGDGTCPEGCAQSAPRVPEGGWPRCPHCQGLVLGERCENPLCRAHWGEPGVPEPENLWCWQPRAGGRPKGAQLRRKYGIPPTALVTVSDPWNTGNLELAWYDPLRRGIFGPGQEDTAEEGEARAIAALLADAGASGFVELDQEQWAERHPVVVNALVAAPGVARERVQAAEAELERREPSSATPRRKVTFRQTREWETLKRLREGAHPRQEELFYAQFDPADLDTPLDIEAIEAGYVSLDEDTTPRAFAARRLGMWGLGGQGHHPQAQQIAEQCGVQLLAADRNPLQPPPPGKGNPEYLGDYTVDGMPLAGLALEFNRHLLVGFPGDTREHKNGWDGLGRVLDYEDYRHNRQNWVTVQIGQPPQARTRRHGTLWVNFGWPQQQEAASAAVSEVAELFLRLGHDPQAKLYYNVGSQQVQTTVGEAARAHQSRQLAGASPAPAGGKTADSPTRVICPFCHKPQAESVCRNPLCPSRWGPPGVPRPENGWRWARPEVPFGQGVGDSLRAKYKIPPDAAVVVSPSHSGMWEIEFYDPEHSGVLTAGQLVYTDPHDHGEIASLLSHPDRTGFVTLTGDDWDRACPQIIEPLVAAPGMSRQVIEQLEAGLAAPVAVDENEVPRAEFTTPAKWRMWDHEHLERDTEKEREFLAQFGSKLDVPMRFTRDGTPERGVLTPRQFAARRLELYGIGQHSHDERAVEIAARCGVTLTNADTCPLVPPGPTGNPEYLFDYTVDGQPIAAFGLDMNRHQMFCWPDDFRMHSHGWWAVSSLRPWGDELLNRQNWVVVYIGGTAGTKRHNQIIVDARRHPVEQRAAITREVAELLLRAGHDPEAEVLTWRKEGETTKMTLREAAAGQMPRPTPPGLRTTEVGQRLLKQVLEPYQRWEHQRPLGGTPAAKQAANQLARAARVLREALQQIEVHDGRLLEDLTELSLGARDRAENDVTGLVADFSRLKAQAHIYLRESAAAAELYGGGFARLFGG